ncbi:hypothetical protein C1701_02745 [Actinoalloteichus sp. AHMU CJ021]|uniref:helix-turn-helix domain-containing protein n=1 Tax=Actinoalloteichus sp. AHMU CJ021 TaxID=2072503 RepID=UPI000CA08C4A|nr:hypothetical protein C1701_02745 [Actinoalloteichus sp. AHMU CJ021]
MINPYVRRQRLAVELRVLREVAGLTHADLAKRIGQSRMKITRLENGHSIRDSQATGMRLIDELGLKFQASRTARAPVYLRGVDRFRSWCKAGEFDL